MGFIKVLLLIAAASAHYIGFRPPCPPASKDDQVYTGSLFEKVVIIFVNSVRVVITTLCLAHAAMVISLHYPSATVALTPHLCPHPSSQLNLLATTSPLFLFGVFIIGLAALLRVWCYTTLGTMFTYRVTIKPSHSLIISGPYAYMRHPSYTGVLFLLIGSALTFRSAGSYIDECGLMVTPVRWLIRTWYLFSIFSIFSLTQRAKVEDALMHETFGVQWIDYSRTVTKSFIPGLV
ncbi:uncharacterized protein FIBRA_08691 [Fibroporia radiculosa]|uniref:Protein-S-isoprenylcysteine O-methyltransferase n=1 Tax=Fibroporia radiculosa TaxID=599839 RepID=J4GX96_9APHY|nr:uncharacterized protein FIBRA_08691 [Fibroporia radiculosa]CCM06430.1 predicted protein [Fibroporia radiculosa]